MCTTQLQLPKNSRERLKLVLIKDGFEEIEHEFPFGTFRPEKQDYLFRRFVTPGNFPPKRPKKFVLYLLSNRIFQKSFENGEQPNDKLLRHCMD